MTEPADEPAARASRPTRVLVASHGHPEITKGGAENAAFQLYGAVGQLPGVESWFLGAGLLPGQGAETCFTQPFSEREFVYAPSSFNWFNFANRDPRFPKEMTRLLLELRPDVVHFHHYAIFGVEVFSLIRRILPETRIVLTLHEFLAICNHFGQMVTKGDLHLCRRASDVRCARCFPDTPPSDFFLRRRYIQTFLGNVDLFIACSAFLAGRYLDWGLPAEKMVVLENVVPPATGALGRPAGRVLRVGFFGQISRLKGIDVLLQAAEQLEKEERETVGFEIFGDYRNQPEVFRADLEKRLAAPRTNLRFHGPYDREEVDTLMRSVDLVLVPSIWWENSPLVIEEALRNRRPVLCSDIGGMAEKVRDGVDGFHFRAGSAHALAELLRTLDEDRERIAGVVRTMRSPTQAAQIAEEHLALYHLLMSVPRATAG